MGGHLEAEELVVISKDKSGWPSQNKRVGGHLKREEWVAISKEKSRWPS